MNDNNTNPDESRGPPTSSGSDQWILKSLNDLKADIQKADDRSSKAFGDVSDRLSGMDSRLGAIEGKLSKVLWTIAGAGIVLGIMFGGFELLTSYFDVSITPKAY